MSDLPNLVIAVTDGDWFEMLRRQAGPRRGQFLGALGGQLPGIQPGELFPFELHAPRNVMVGGGIFAYANALPCSLAWEALVRRGERRALGAGVLRAQRQVPKG